MMTLQILPPVNSLAPYVYSVVSRNTRHIFPAVFYLQLTNEQFSHIHAALSAPALVGLPECYEGPTLPKVYLNVDSPFSCSVRYTARPQPGGDRLRIEAQCGPHLDVGNPSLLAPAEESLG